MRKINFKAIAKTFGNTLSKYSPEILVSVGVAGMLTSVILAVKETPKAIEKKEELEAANSNPSKLDYIKHIWPIYIPSACAFAASATAILGGYSIKEHRNAAFATAYKLSETALKEYKEAAKEIVGEDNANKIMDRAIEKRVNTADPREEFVVNTPHGNQLFYDPASDRFFRSSVNAVNAAKDEFNNRLKSGEEEIETLNDFYELLGLGTTSLGDDYAWNYWNSSEDDLLQIRYRGKNDLYLGFESAIWLDYEPEKRYMNFCGV